MENQPKLSPNLRPLRYCPHCGQRVAQKAETCFMCGHSFNTGQQRRVRLPIGDLLLIAVVLGVAYLWWTRGVPADSLASQPPTPTPTAASPTATPDAAAVAASPTATPTITPTPTPIVYLVVSGDTVERIATRYGIAVEDLMIANGLTSDLIRIDQQLVIPPGPLPRGPDGRPLPTATPTPVSAIYLVQVRAGDTLENIAARLDTTVDLILAANESLEGANSIIRPGDQLVVPVGTVSVSPTPPPDQLPTATPVPTPTPTPGTRWPAPRLLAPANGAQLDGQPVLLQWLSVGLLAPDEVYVVRVEPEGRPRDELTTITVGSSFRAPEDWLKRQARRSVRFLWSVQVARDVRAIAGQTTGLLAASPPSEVRTFTWTNAP